MASANNIAVRKTADPRNMQSDSCTIFGHRQRSGRAVDDETQGDARREAVVGVSITLDAPCPPNSSTPLPARAYVSSFNFRGTDQQKLVGALSGGERYRVHLAKLLQSGGNVLLLDEPTNDLDVDTLRALEAGLESFPGCVVVIGHDRWFVDPDRDAYPGVRGRQPGSLLPGQRHRRGVPAQGTRH